MSRRRPQKGKHLKRKKAWHRGGVEHHKWEAAMRRWPRRKHNG